MQNLGKGKGQVSKSGKMSNDDDLTSLAWLHNVNILPDSVASDDDQGGLTSPEVDKEKVDKFQFNPVIKTSTSPSNSRIVKASKPFSTTPTTPTTTTNSFRLTNVSSPNHFSSNLIISSSSGATSSYSPSVLLNSLLVSPASMQSQHRGCQSPFPVAAVNAKNIVVVSTASANGIYPGQS